MKFAFLILLTAGFACAAPVLFPDNSSPVKDTPKKSWSVFSWIGRLFSRADANTDATSAATTSLPHTTVVSLSEQEALIICSWNIFRFGPGKFSVPDPLVTAGKNITRLGIILDQLEDCDIAVIQEYIDASQTVSETLRKELVNRTGKQFNKLLSPRLGVRNLEQYLFLYRPDKVTLGRSVVYPDVLNASKLFNRQPFFVNVTRSHNHSGKLTHFILGTIHTAPDRAVAEVGSLVQAFDWAAQNYSAQEIMIIGDYNADCSYVREGDWQNIPLWTEERFTWLVKTGTSTTSMSTHCTYDRAVYIGAQFRDSFVPDSVQAPDFTKKFNLTASQAKLVSDHRLVKLAFD